MRQKGGKAWWGFPSLAAKRRGQGTASRAGATRSSWPLMRVFDRAICGAKALHGSVRKDAQPHNSIVRSVGIGEPSPTSFFCEINRRGIEAKKQGVYHLALLATNVSKKTNTPRLHISSILQNNIHLSQKRVILFARLLQILVNLWSLIYNVMVITMLAKRSRR